jgi:hypothetical protein
MAYTVRKIAPNTELKRVPIADGKFYVERSPRSVTFGVYDSSGALVKNPRNGAFEIYSRKQTADQVAESYNASPQKAERAVIKAAKRAGLKVSDDSPRVIAGAVRAIQRTMDRNRRIFQDYDDTPSAQGDLRTAVLDVASLWKRLLGVYPSLYTVASKTRINEYLSPAGMVKVFRGTVDPEQYHNAITHVLGTIAQYFERQG